MRNKAWTAFLALSVIAVTATAADACSRNVSAKAAQTYVPAKNINQSLLDDAIRVEVNYHRCRAGLSALGDAGNSLTEQAKKHSNWMARTQNLSHKSNVAGHATLSQRIKRSGVKFRTGAENIGMVHRYQIDNKRFRIIDSSACKFATSEGQTLPAHSYASLARHSVNLWMQSPGHRKNILDRRMKAISSAGAFDGKSQYCGRFFLTQNFIG